jgi:hypothetical protein
MDEVYELPGQPQTFALQNSRDMLKKLRWEIDELRAEPGYPVGHNVAYRANDCAVTAWSLADWFWEELDDTDKTIFNNKVKEFRTHTNALEICESLANSAKHRKRKPKLFNAGVETKMLAQVKHFCAGDVVGQPLATWKWEAIILHHGVEHKAIDVFERAYTDWLALIDRYSHQ